jgi:HK97 family phage portal protein
MTTTSNDALHRAIHKLEWGDEDYTPIEEQKAQARENQTMAMLDNMVNKDFNPLQYAHDEDGATTSLWSSEVNALMNMHTLKAMFFSEDWVYIVVDLIASMVSRQPLKVYRQDFAENGEVSTEPVSEHPINLLFEQPNEMQSYAEFMYNSTVELILMGNDITWAGSTGGQLITLPAEKVQLDFDEKGRVRAYRFARSSEEFFATNRDQLLNLNPKQIAHFRRPNPASIYWGLSPFIAGRKQILFSRYSQDYLNQFYLRQALPSMVLETEKHLNEENALRLLRTVEMAYTGRRNARRTMILPPGVSSKETAHTIADQNLIQLIDKNRESILNILKVPKHALSLAEAGSLGSEEHKMALKHFWAATIRPTMEIIAQGWTKYYQGQLEENEYLDFDCTDVELLREDEFKQAELAEKMLLTHTLNEVRAKVYAEEPLEGGDKIPGSQSSDPFGGLFEGAAPSLPDSQDESNAGEDAEEDTKAVTDYRKQAIYEKYKDVIASHTKQMDDEIEQADKTFIDVIMGIFAEFAGVAVKSVMDNLRDSKSYKTKAEGSKRSVRTDMVRGFEEMANTYLDAVVNQFSDTLERGYNVQAAPVFDIVDVNALLTIQERTRGKRRATLEARALDTFANVSKTTTNQIMQIVEDGLKDQLTVQEIAEQVAVKLGDPDATLSRATTISRTETLTAVSIGQAAATEDIAKLIPDLKKVWITAQDDRVRDSHAALDGKTIDHDKKFGNGLKYPREPGGAAEETINCRCTLLIMPPEDVVAMPPV